VLISDARQRVEARTLSASKDDALHEFSLRFQPTAESRLAAAR
jgi:hypothetical protein